MEQEDLNEKARQMLLSPKQSRPVTLSDLRECTFQERTTTEVFEERNSVYPCDYDERPSVEVADNMEVVPENTLEAFGDFE